MPTQGKLEIVVKINELPDAKPVQNGWMAFDVDCGGAIVSITVKPKIWKKLTDAQSNYQQWVSAIGGSMGSATGNGFVLDNPNVQVFERKPKEAKVESVG